jgi:hypothetical protein
VGSPPKNIKAQKIDRKMKFESPLPLKNLSRKRRTSGIQTTDVREVFIFETERR